MAQKVVKFYRPVYVHQDGTREEVDSAFWKDAHTSISSLDPDQRGVNHRGASFFGEASTGLARAYPFIRVGRVRYRADWPETIDPGGQVEELVLEGKDIFEGSYLVPFGTQAKVAIMGPIRGLVTTSAMEWWLTHTLDLATAEVSLELVPEVDPSLARKLNEAEGASRLSVRLPKGSVLDLDPESQMEEAFASAHGASDDELNVELGFSFGHQRPRGDRPGMLKRAAIKIAESGAAEKVDVSLMLHDGDGYKIEQHDLIRDRVSFTVSFDVEDGERIGIEEALAGIHDAIERYRAL